MWDNIGRRLQSLAKVVCWIGIISSVIWGIVIMTQSNRYQSTILSGILTIVIGFFASWIGSWAMYGLGLVVEYVENGGAASAPSGPAGTGIRTDDGGVLMTGTSYWECPKCKTRNPFSKVACRECGTIRQ